MPEKEREILEKNLNLYGDMDKMKKVLNVAKSNKVISEELKSLELISKTGELSDRIFELMLKEENLEVLEQYIVDYLDGVVNTLKKENDAIKYVTEVSTQDFFSSSRRS